MTDRELLLERLERLAIVLDELMPQCAELVRDAIPLLKEQLWHRMDWDKYSGLENHFYYLVTIPEFGTPMKAKWHDEGYWEVLGIKSIPGWGKYVYPYDEENSNVVAWMDLPEVYGESR